MLKALLTFTLILLPVVISSCGRDSLSSSERTSLQAEYNTRLAELRTMSLGHTAGWPSDEDCDGALWAGIALAK